jgi:hypothetical protein
MTTRIARDLNDALARLRLARIDGDLKQIVVSEKRLNWLIDSQLSTNPRREKA